MEWYNTTEEVNHYEAPERLPEGVKVYYLSSPNVYTARDGSSVTLSEYDAKAIGNWVRSDALGKVPEANEHIVTQVVEVAEKYTPPPRGYFKNKICKIGVLDPMMCKTSVALLTLNEPGGTIHVYPWPRGVQVTHEPMLNPELHCWVNNGIPMPYDMASSVLGLPWEVLQQYHSLILSGHSTEIIDAYNKWHLDIDQWLRKAGQMFQGSEVKDIDFPVLSGYVSHDAPKGGWRERINRMIYRAREDSPEVSSLFFGVFQSFSFKRLILWPFHFVLGIVEKFMG